MHFRSCLLLAVILCAIPARSQTLRGSIVGRVTDVSNQPVANILVTLTQEETNRARSTRTDANGEFAAVLLPVGVYRVEASGAGYRTTTRSVLLSIDQEVNIDMPLLPEKSTERVQVTSEAGLLKTESASLGTVVPNRQVQNSPLDGRNFYELGLLVPGVVPAAQGSAGSDRGDFTFNVNGGREDSNSWLLDGVYNGDPKLNGFSTAPPVDAVREFEVLTNSADASFGRNAGSQINVVLMSGTNRVHGTAFEFLRNSVLDGQNYFAPPSLGTPKDIRNDFGGSLGGPIAKDRTFFFLDYEGQRVRDGITQETNVPTLLERNGDFSKSGASLTPIDLFTGAPFPGSIIPQSRIDPTAARIAALYPLPNLPTPGQDFVSSPSETDRNDHFDVRVDHNFSKTSELTFHYSFGDRAFYEPFPAPGNSLLLGYGNNVPRRSQNLMLSETHILTPNLLNEARIAFNRISLEVNQQVLPGRTNLAVGLPVISTKARDAGLSEISVTGYSELGQEINNPQRDTANDYELADNLSYNHGRHLARFGADVRILQQNAFADVESRGLLDFLGYTGNALAELLQDFPTVTAIARLDNPQHLRTHSYNFYGQDTFRARPNLTLIFGLRYEYNTPPVDPQNRATLYNPATQSIVPLGQNGIPRAGYNSDFLDFAPRVGIAWTPDAARRWVVRSGYGIYYDQSPLAPSEGLYFSPPYFNSQLFISSQQTPLFLENPFPLNTPNLIPSSAFEFQRNLRTGYLQEWNVTVQRQLGASSVAELSYVGSKGTKLIANRDVNPASPNTQEVNLRPVPQFSDIDALESRANSDYNAMQAKFQQHLRHGLSGLASYTWAKSIDDASGYFSSDGDTNFPQNSNNARADRGLSNFDVRSRFVAGYSYDLPLPRTNILLRGWQTNGIWTFQSGRPFTVTLLAGEDQSNTGIPGVVSVVDRPNLIGTAKLSNPGPNAWFNTGAFALQPFGTFGSAGRNILEGPGLSSIDVSLVKNTAIREGVNLQFRAEVFNLANSANFALPDGELGSSTFGHVLAAGTPRRVQFGLKILF